MFEIPYLKDFFRSLKETSIDDAVDRISYFWTTWMIVFMSLAVTGKQLFGSPIECMMPAEFPYAWNNYVREFCYVTSTYTKPMNSKSTPMEKADATTHGYYQWIPFILMLQALFIYLPHLIRKHFQQKQVIDFQYVVDQAVALRMKNQEQRHESITEIVEYLKQRLHYQGNKNGTSHVGFGSKATLLHILSKILTAFVIMCQLHFMNSTFGNVYDPYWGLTMIKQALSNSGWNQTGVFPRITFCNFNQPKLGGVYPLRVVQCVLMVNMINEKIFVFLWFWFAFSLILSILNIIYVSVVLFVPVFRRQSARYYVKKVSPPSEITTTYTNVEDDTMIDFAADAFGPDGLHLFHFIRIHSGAQVAVEVASQLFDSLFEADSTSQAEGSFLNGHQFNEKKGKPNVDQF